ncbi:MAG TPA: hypothetical protein VGK06_06520 [Methanosarcina sp.]|jgi:hypothetical protein
MGRDVRLNALPYTGGLKMASLEKLGSIKASRITYFIIFLTFTGRQKRAPTGLKSKVSK